MNIASRLASIVIPLCLPYTLFVGCSVVGAVVGGVASPAREGMLLKLPGLDSVGIGEEVQVYRHGGSTLKGVYKGFVVYPAKMYARTYDTLTARASFGDFIPGLNQRITVRSSGRTEEGNFLGIDRGELLVQSAPGSDTLGVPLDDVQWLQSPGSLRLEGRVLVNLVRAGRIPGRTLVVIACDGTQEMIPYESIEIVQIPSSRSGVLAGFLIGAAVDVTVVALTLSAERQRDADCAGAASGGGNQSCTSAHR